MSLADLRLSILQLLLRHLVRGRPFPGICKKPEEQRRSVVQTLKFTEFFNSLLATEG